MGYPYSPKQISRLERLINRCRTGLPIGLVFVRPDGNGGLYLEPVYTVRYAIDLEHLLDLFGSFWDELPTTTLRRVRPIAKQRLVTHRIRPAGAPYPERFDQWTLFLLRLRQDLIEQWADRPDAILVMLF